MANSVAKQRLHLVASVIATLCIAVFFVSTILVELLGSPEQIATIKGLILAPGLFILIPAIATTGGTGFSLAKERTGKLVEAKKKRMPFIAVIGLLILLPAAYFLEQWAVAGIFDARFYALQAIELLAGATNLTLMGKNLVAGLKLSGRFRQHKVRP